MATFFLDFEGGNDANDGTTFANRWKTFGSGATAARIAPGDLIKVMASPDETLVGNATWTQGSKTVTLAGAVTANITDCESAWTASANVTSTADATVFKENTKAAKHVIAAAFTTGKVSFFATGTLDLSAYQQVSFWIQPGAAHAAGVFTLTLCSDTGGATPVNTITIPALGAAAIWQVVTVDTGGALGSSIKSIALNAVSDPGAVTMYLDNIIACKASSSADSLTLDSAIGKVWNKVWVASTTYATNDIRKPTQPNRNGFRYKITGGGGGASGGSEPTWPDYIGATVSDGALTWTCEGVEDTWYGIQSINGTTVKLDNAVASTGAAGRGYGGETETVATYKREGIKQTVAPANATQINNLTESGTQALPTVYSGGWDRTAMTTQSGETWFNGQNGNGALFLPTSGVTNFEIININGYRYGYGMLFNGTTGVIKLTNCQYNNMTTAGYLNNSDPANLIYKGGASCNNGTGAAGSVGLSVGNYTLKRLRLENNAGTAGINIPAGETVRGTFTDILTRNNATYGIQSVGAAPITINNLISANNGTAGIRDFYGTVTLNNASIAEATEFVALTAFYDGYIYSHNHDQTVDNHLITTDGGTIIAATDQRNTASGISWKFRITSTNRGALYPMKLPVARIACAANVAVTVKIYTRRDSTNIQGELFLPANTPMGLNEATVSCAPSINTWTQSGALTFTPTAAGVVEIFFRCWDGTGNSNNLWIDDLSIT